MSPFWTRVLIWAPVSFLLAFIAAMFSSLSARARASRRTVDEDRPQFVPTYIRGVKFWRTLGVNLYFAIIAFVASDPNNFRKPLALTSLLLSLAFSLWLCQTLDEDSDGFLDEWRCQALVNFLMLFIATCFALVACSDIWSR